MSWNDAATIEVKLKDALNSFDWSEAETICYRLIDRLNAAAESLPEPTAKELLSSLRKKQCYTLMNLLAEAMMRSGLRTPQIWRQYAQALIDQGELSTPEPILESVIQDSAGKNEEFEARGLLGRLYKQRYVDNNDPKSPANRANLERAIKEYLSVYRPKPDYIWHGINVVALSARARRDGFAMADLPDPSALAKEILAIIADKESEAIEPIGKWEVGTRLEAYVALGLDRNAMDSALRYISIDDADAFEINSTMRQLTEVWQLSDATPLGSQLLTILRAGHLKKRGAAIGRDLGRIKEETARVDAAVKDLQAVFSDDARMVTLKWYQTGLLQCNSVARVEKRNGTGHGTGWLVQASAFFPGHTGTLLLTNAHVVSDNPNPDTNPKALYPKDVKVNFQVMGKEGLREAEDRIVWTSPPQELDATFISLKGEPIAEPLTVHKSVVRMTKPTPRLYIIGHPGGHDLKISLQDNFLLGCNERLMHYRTPTEPGSSGSPVFEPDDWRVVALHHSSSKAMKRLDDQAGTYEANEGISILAIQKATKGI